MRTASTLSLSLTLFLAVACGGGTPSVDSPGNHGSPRPTAPRSALEEESAGNDGLGRAAPPQPGQAPKSEAAAESSAPSDFEGRADRSADGASASAEPLSPRRRPGLGTTWGETRESRVRTVQFVRQNETRPAFVTQLFYNDREGVMAMARDAHGELNRFVAVDAFEDTNGFVTVRVLDSIDRPLPSFASAGRRFVVGTEGEHYSIEVQNHTGQRFEVVASVDGLDVVDGRPGAMSKRGYVLNGFSTLEIDGFRQSLGEVAAFRFGAVDDSYAAKKGQPRNVGVIGVAVFEERGSELVWDGDQTHHRLTADPFPGRFADPPR